MKEDTTRVFFAIALDQPIKRLIYNQIEDLKQKCNLSVRWVKETQLHLTLRFLGNLSEEQIEKLIKGLDFLTETPSFRLEFTDFVAFPANRPRIIGLYISLSNALAKLVANLEKELDRLGYEPEERAFMPHITLGRIVKPRRKHLDFGESQVFPKQPVKAICLYKSQLTPDGSIYTLIKEFPLGPLPLGGVVE